MLMEAFPEIADKVLYTGAIDGFFKTVIAREYPQEWLPGRMMCRPVQDEKNMALYKKYLALAAERPDVIFGGRLGDYKYYDMDDAIAAALDRAVQE